MPQDGVLRLKPDAIEGLDGTGVTLSFFGVAPVTRPSAYTQTFATADKTHDTDGSTAVAAADAVAAAAATATSIAAAIPAAAPAGGVGAAAGGWDTGANRDLAITTINDLRTWAIEVDLDYEAVVVDVASIRTQYAAAVTLANELKADFNLLRTTVDDLKRLVNSVIDDLQALGLLQ